MCVPGIKEGSFMMTALKDETYSLGCTNTDLYIGLKAIPLNYHIIISPN